jgi:hypothetical protein
MAWLSWLTGGRSVLGFPWCNPGDGVEGVGRGFVAVHGLAFRPQLAQSRVVEDPVEQFAGLMAKVSD